MQNYTGLYIFLWVALIVILVGAVLVVLQQKKTIKTMLLGLTFILFGGIVAIDPNHDLDRFAYAFQIIGVVLSVIGFLKNDHE